jgi:hypothetical protein
MCGSEIDLDNATLVKVLYGESRDEQASRYRRATETENLDRVRVTATVSQYRRDCIQLRRNHRVLHAWRTSSVRRIRRRLGVSLPPKAYCVVVRTMCLGTTPRAKPYSALGYSPASGTLTCYSYRSSPFCSASASVLQGCLRWTSGAIRATCNASSTLRNPPGLLMKWMDRQLNWVRVWNTYGPKDMFY